MEHIRNESLGSPSFLSSLSPITSTSSRSAESYNQNLKPEIANIEQSEIDLSNLVEEAEELIKNKFSGHPQSIFSYKVDEKEASVNLDAVMDAMLAHAEECGGESGKRYVASAIVACGRKGGDDDVVEALVALGTTWLTHLLFIFKTSRSHETQPDQEPSEYATPTVDVTASYVGEGVGRRAGSFKSDVILRDGYTCVLTGVRDLSHPGEQPAGGPHKAKLRASHILRRAIGTFDKDHKSDSFKSAVTSFDILVNFTRLPLEDLHSHLDDPSNGMTLHSDAHEAFDDFGWCLKQTKTQDVYTLKVYKDWGIMRKPEGNLITFRDHSGGGGLVPGSARKRTRSIPLPDRHYIAIHAAIAGVLNMSGAGKFFDELLGKYSREDQVNPIRSWLDLEKAIEEVVLQEFVEASLQSVKVC